MNDPYTAQYHDLWLRTSLSFASKPHMQITGLTTTKRSVDEAVERVRQLHPNDYANLSEHIDLSEYGG